MKYFNDFKAFIEYPSDMEYTHKKIDEYNQNKELKILVKLDDKVADMRRNKKKFNQWEQNHLHFFIIKIKNKQDFQQIAISYLSDNEIKDFMNL